MSQLGFDFPKPKREPKLLKVKQDAYDAANVEAAQIILADPEKYGGEEGLMVRCSRLTMERIFGK